MICPFTNQKSSYTSRINRDNISIYQPETLLYAQYIRAHREERLSCGY
jgi:hypothetical protein